MTLEEFMDSLRDKAPPDGLSPYLKSLWWDQKGAWDKAHDLVDAIGDTPAAWIHAYLHRKEGDQWNANYWYKRAKKPMPNSSLEAEWKDLVEHFLNE